MQALQEIASLITARSAAESAAGALGTAVRRTLARLRRLTGGGTISVGPVSQEWLIEYDRQSGRHGQL
ncbi:MAG TPA: hypothetical protein VNI78_11010 [Vicinamibacterales bacterium]|nr:hypothetical protein [Vicinamibacterales bacterium]